MKKNNDNFRTAYEEVERFWQHCKYHDRRETPHPQWHGFGVKGDGKPSISLFLDPMAPKKDRDRLVDLVHRKIEKTNVDVQDDGFHRFRQIGGGGGTSPRKVRPGTGITSLSPQALPFDDTSCPGTIGAFIRERGTESPVYLLTCSHVLLGDDRNPRCVREVQVTSSQGQIIADDEVTPVLLQDNPAVNAVDVAVVPLKDPRIALAEYRGLHLRSTVPRCPVDGARVRKLGATSEVTRGRILYSLCQTEVLDCSVRNKFLYSDVMVIEPIAKGCDFAEDGDSGALVASGGHPVGLLFASGVDEKGKTAGLACPWGKVMEQVSFALNFEAEMMLHRPRR